MGAGTDGEWHHLSYVKAKNPDESGKAITAIFQDGAPIVTSPGCDIECWSNGRGFFVNWAEATIDDVLPITRAAIGAAPGGGGSQDGRLDDFAIWDEALSTERIVALANNGPCCAIPCCHFIGDFNSDGNLDTADFTILANNFNASFPREEAFFKGDMDGNRRVDLNDFLVFRELFQLVTARAVASTIPEPSGLSLGLASCLVITWCRQRIAPARDRFSGKAHSPLDQPRTS